MLNELNTKFPSPLRARVPRDSVSVVVEVNDAVSLFNFQVMVGVGAPVEIQEMVAEFPSDTVTTDSILVVVLASTV